MTRSISAIARDIHKAWPKVNFGAKPYLEAMGSLDKITDPYFGEDARCVVVYFLSNATTFRGEEAKALKAELKALLV